MPDINTTELINKIGDYSVADDMDVKAKAPSVNRTNIAKLFGKEGCEELYRGIDMTPSRKARIAFIKHLEKVMNDPTKQYKMSPKKHDPRSRHPEKHAVKLEKMLGKTGLKLYLAAVKEEKNSIEFRDAVAAEAVSHYKGPKWGKRLRLFIGGPSASGKTYAKDMLVDKIRSDIMDNTVGDSSNLAGNDVVAIDGNLDREVSQMRQLVLQAGLALGYPGISDLHKKTDVSVKRNLKAAAEKANLNLVIPTTFSKQPIAGISVSTKQQKDTVEVFSRVVGSNLSSFQNKVKLMGISRTFKTEFPKGEKLKVKMNNRNIGVESKKYGKRGFKFGFIGSKHQELKAKKLGLPCYTILNDLIFARKNKDSGKWEQTRTLSEGVQKISKRVFDKICEDDNLSCTDNLKEAEAIIKRSFPELAKLEIKLINPNYYKKNRSLKDCVLDKRNNLTFKKFEQRGAFVSEAIGTKLQTKLSSTDSYKVKSDHIMQQHGFDITHNHSTIIKLREHDDRLDLTGSNQSIVESYMAAKDMIAACKEEILDTLEYTLPEIIEFGTPSRKSNTPKVAGIMVAAISQGLVITNHDGTIASNDFIAEFMQKHLVSLKGRKDIPHELQKAVTNPREFIKEHSDLIHNSKKV